jgi:hypothetical protein
MVTGRLGAVARAATPSRKGDVDTDSRIYPGLERKPGGPDNWVEAAGGLPDYIERIAKHLHYEQGFTIAHAIATAVNTVKRWARGGAVVEGGKNNVTAKTQALAAKALAEWNAKKGASVSMTAGGERVIELARYVATQEGARFYGVPIGALITQKGAQQRVRDALNPGMKLALPSTRDLSQGEKLELKEARDAVHEEMQKLRKGGDQSPTTNRYRERIEKAVARNDFSGVLFELRSILASGELSSEDLTYYRKLMEKALKGNKPPAMARR